MNNECDITYIGKEIRNIRKYKKLTQEDISFATNLSIDTIRRLESGKVDIKISSLLKVLDTLGIEFYNIFDTIEKSKWSTIEKYLLEIDFSLNSLDLDKARELLIDFEKLDTSQLSITYKKRYEQNLGYYKVVLNENITYEQCINNLIDLIKINHENFSVEKFALHSFTKFELRILRTIANRLRNIGEIDLGRDILLFIESQINETSKDYPLVAYTISRYYDLDNNFEKASFRNGKAIRTSINNNDILGLIYSYYQKGDLLIKQKDGKAMDYINMSFELCRLSGRKKLEENLKKYLNYNFK